MDMYYESKTAVLNHISSLEYTKSTVDIYNRCLDAFGLYLNENNIAYSSETAFAWVEKQKEKIGASSWCLYRAAIFKLDHYYNTGLIQGYYSNSRNTMWGHLSSDYQKAIDGLIRGLNRSAATKSNIRYGCVKVLLQIQNTSGHMKAEEITYDDLFDLLESFSRETVNIMHFLRECMKTLLDYLYSMGRVSYGFTLFPRLTIGRNCLKQILIDTENSEGILNAKDKDCPRISLGTFLSVQSRLVLEYKNECYSKTSRTKVKRITDMIYCFMESNGLKFYSPEVGRIWLHYHETAVSHQEHRERRRIVSILNQHIDGTFVSFKHVYRYKPNAFARSPEWCKPAVAEFLHLKESLGMKSSTMAMFSSCLYRFCSYMDSIGIKDFKKITVPMIKDFNASDIHKTLAGKNAYNSRIRKFLEHLGEQGLLQNPFLFLALPCTFAKREHVVETLTADEQDRLQRILDEQGSGTLSLRRKAMIQLGYRLGMRSIDIVKLTIDDIDWNGPALSFRQEKTEKQLVLPMPAPVANAISKYILEERPATNCRQLFIRSKAPYCGLARSACIQALDKALTERNVKGSGFHVTRKTFATNMLRNGAYIQEVSDALGHSDLTNVHKYLVFDEDRMARCALKLSERSLTMEGGFLHE